MSRLLKPEGLRGKAMTDITPELMLRLGRAAAQAIGKSCSHPPVFYLSHDSRLAADALEAALCSGICAGGGHAHILGVLPSAGMAMMLAAEDAEAGISLSCGDQPFEQICVRLFAKSGALMSAEQLDSISVLMQNGTVSSVSGRNCGQVQIQNDAQKRCLRLLGTRLIRPGLREKKRIRIAIDCANGAASVLAEPLFKQLGAEVLVMNDNPDGININQECGVKHTDKLAEFVQDYSCSAGFSFDGDAARFIAVDETGETLDCDRCLAILCEDRLQEQAAAPPMLPKTMLRGVAVTVMTNLGFLRYAQSRNIPVYTTQPAQPFMTARMRKLVLPLGGDGRGLIYTSDSPAPDGLIAAAYLLQALQRTGKPLSELASVMEHDPQVMTPARIPAYWKEIWKNDPEISGFIAQCQEELGMEGRIVVRERRDDSPIINVMVEGRDFRKINSYLMAITEKITQCTHR